MQRNTPPRLPHDAALDACASGTPAGAAPPPGRTTWALAIVWFAVVGVGTGSLWQYQHRASIEPPSLRQWPTDSRLMPAAEHSTLLFFVHPKCPCTRASIGELEQIMIDCRDQLRAYAIFSKPPEVTAVAWEQTDLWTSAEQIPGVTVICDTAGVEARRFNAATSGLTMLYDQQGRLRFSGGITSSRGHRGQNPGRSTIVQLVMQGTAAVDSSPVYGCELNTPRTSAGKACCRN